MNLATAAVLVAGSALGGVAQAAEVMFSDNFDNETLGLTADPNGWTVFDGNVDLIGKDLANNTSYDLLPGNGVYVDMVGTGGASGSGAIRTDQTFDLTPGLTYTLTYSLAGSQRGDGDNSVEAIIGDFNGGPNPVFVTHTLGSSAAFQLFTQTFTVSSVLNDVRIAFRSISPNDNQGLLLDNVTLTAVPLPAAAWLLLSGLIGFAALGRRKPAA